MRALTATAVVHSDHTLTVPVPRDITPGVHQVVVVLQEDATSPQQEQLFTGWSPHQVGLVDPNMTFRREDMVGDDGR